MWYATSVSLTAATLDFSSSGQKDAEVHRLIIDGIQVANAVELTDWNPDNLQLDVCESCGYVHCHPGGWASLRRLGPYALLTPAFESLRSDPEEYAPPPALRERGAVIFRPDIYSRLRELIPALRPLADLPPLIGREAAVAFQLEAPMAVLGRPPADPVLASGAVVAVDHGSIDEMVADLQRILTSLSMSEKAVSVRSGVSAQEVQTFILDRATFPSWPAFIAGGSPALFFPPGLAVGGVLR